MNGLISPMRMVRDGYYVCNSDVSVTLVQMSNIHKEGRLQALYKEIKSVRFVTVSLIPHAPMKSPYFATRDWM